MHYSALTGAGQVNQLPAFIGADAAESTLSLAYLTFVHADAASHALSIPRRRWRQTESLPGKRMKLH